MPGQKGNSVAQTNKSKSSSRQAGGVSFPTSPKSPHQHDHRTSASRSAKVSDVPMETKRPGMTRLDAASTAKVRDPAELNRSNTAPQQNTTSRPLNPSSPLYIPSNRSINPTPSIVSNLIPLSTRAQPSLPASVQARIAFRDRRIIDKALEGNRHPTAFGVNRGLSLWETRNLEVRHGMPGLPERRVLSNGHRGRRAEMRKRTWDKTREEWDSMLGREEVKTESGLAPANELTSSSLPRVVVPRTLKASALIGGKAESEHASNISARIRRDIRRRRAASEGDDQGMALASYDATGDVDSDAETITSTSETDSVFAGSTRSLPEAEMRYAAVDTESTGSGMKLNAFSSTDAATEADKLDLFSASSVTGNMEADGIAMEQIIPAAAEEASPLSISLRMGMEGEEHGNPTPMDQSPSIPSPKILDEDWGAAPAKTIVYSPRNYLRGPEHPPRIDGWGNEIRVKRREPLAEDFRTRNAYVPDVAASGPSWPNSIPLGARRSDGAGGLLGGPQRDGPRQTMGTLRQRTVSFPASLAPPMRGEPMRRGSAGRGPRSHLSLPRFPLTSRGPVPPHPALHSREWDGPPHLYRMSRTRRPEPRSRFPAGNRPGAERLTWNRGAQRLAQEKLNPKMNSQTKIARERPYRFATDSFAIGSEGKDGNFDVGFCAPTVESSIAWDPLKRAFLLDVIPIVPEGEGIPQALEMIDAKIDLADIATRGVSLSWAPVDGTPLSREGLPFRSNGRLRDVTLTLSLKRPPQFFVPLLDHEGRFCHRGIKVEAPPELGDLLARSADNSCHRLLDLSSLRSVDPYLAEYWASRLPTEVGNSGRTRKLSGGIFLGPREAVMAKELRELLKKVRRLPSNPSLRGPIGYDAVQPDGLSGRIRRKPIETGVIRWRRATEHDFSVSRGGSEQDSGSLCVDNDVKYKINFWLTYKFTFYMDESGFASLERLLEHLRLKETEDDEVYLDTLMESMKVVVDPEKPFRPLPEANLIPQKLVAIASLNQLPFSSRYLIEGLVSQAILRVDQVEDLIDGLSKTAEPHKAFTDEVLHGLYTLESIPDVPATLRRRFSKSYRAHTVGKTWKAKEKIHTNQATVRRVVITPTRMLAFPPEQENSNSVLRMFSKFRDRFLRVQFNDEHDRLTINPQVAEADRINGSCGTIARVRRTLASGLTIAGRRYAFLAASSSQSKETSAWFFANVSKRDNDGEQSFTVQDILAALGTLTEQVIAKHAARQGLAFSGSVPLQISVKRRNKLLDDIIRVQNGESYTFTDGVGKCAADICIGAAEALGMSQEAPSALQFRMAGSKGLLVAWPDVKPREIWLRASQVKYQGGDQKRLHCVRVSGYRCAFLNRQYIILLVDLGVPREVFQTMFMQQAARVLDLPTRVKSGAISGEDLAMIEEVSAFPIRPLIVAGYAADPVVQDVLSVIERRLLADLRWHARIEIQDGVYAYGVADESGTLEEGEVFCQYKADTGSGARIAQGKCTICRAPALHPGDIRIVNAVDKPALRHLKNVIVFSVKGDRSLPNKLGGGDLDGDEYTLIWDKRIVDKVKEVAPAEYSSPKPEAVAWVQPSDIKENYVRHMLNDILGIVGNAHLAFADLEGPSSIRCLKLCGIHSTAVDFAKTGIPAILPPDLRPSRYPEYMNKPAHMSYPGKSILGDLFRQATTFEGHLTRHFHPKTLHDVRPSDMDPRISRVKVPISILQMAVRLKRSYDVEMSYLLMRYQLTEMEVLSGLALRNGKRKRVRDNDLKEPLRNAYKELVCSTRELAEHAMEAMRLPETGNSHLQLFAAAAYQVTFSREWDPLFDDGKGKSAEPVEQDDDLEEPKLISFAWILWKEILSLSGATA